MNTITSYSFYWNVLIAIDKLFSWLRERNKPYCCKLLCFKSAEWTICYGETPTPDDYTDACTKHVGCLLDDSDIFTVYPVE